MSTPERANRQDLKVSDVKQLLPLRSLLSQTPWCPLALRALSSQLVGPGVGTAPWLGLTSAAQEYLAICTASLTDLESI